MESSATDPDALVEKALAEAADADGFLPMDRFVEIALYHPRGGYYRRRGGVRVGRRPDADFFTASSLAEAFAPAVSEAAAGLLRQAEIDPAQATWFEIGAENPGGLLGGRPHPFARAAACGVEEPPPEISGPTVLFANELLDAQPFASVQFEAGVWRERGARSEEGGVWRLATRAAIPPRLRPSVERLPKAAPEGYIVDLPGAAVELLERLLAPDWRGALIVADYGKTWQALVSETPQGTARAYRGHRQVPDLFANPGRQDLTCHVCWDWLEEACRRAGFREIRLESQETFVVRRAPKLLERAFAPEQGPLSPLRSQLKQLIHPTLMGQAFQALTAIRT